MKTIDDTINFDAYFAEQEIDSAKIKPASSWATEVIDNFYGDTSAKNWTPMGYEKMAGKFDLRPGELTLWTGVNGHGKTTLLSNIMLKVMQRGQKVCIVSPEMKPAKTMSKMTQQAAGVGTPSIRYINGFHQWTDNKLWVYDHLGKLASNRVLAVATYVRKELGIDHLVIDSLMRCGVGPEDYAAQKDFVDALTSIARDTGLHVHLVCHMRKGENEFKPPEKFDVKGASEIVDLTDNLVIVWMNMLKVRDLTAAESERDPVKRQQLIDQLSGKADSFVRLAKQRHHPWTGSWAFWFDKASQQYLENDRAVPQYNGLTLDLSEQREEEFCE